MKRVFERRFIVTELVECEVCGARGRILTNGAPENCPSCLGQCYLRREVNMKDAMDYIFKQMACEIEDKNGKDVQNT